MAVLQAAIQGKLTSHLSSDSDVNEMIVAAEKEKESLVREKIIKKEKPQLPISDDEVLYDLPDNWATVRLGDYIFIRSGDGLTSSKYIKGPYPVYGGNGINGYHNAYNVPKGTLVIGRVGFYCGSVHETIDNAWVTDNALIVTFLSCFSKPYLKLLLTALDLGKNTNQTAQPLVTGKIIKPKIAPLPPIEEQARIVARVDELMAKIDEYEKIEKELTKLQKAFPENMKDAILQAAMQGKLTEQLESDGDAHELESNLVKKMKATLSDKAFKKSKAFEDITDEEIPFDIPDNWTWTRFGKLASVLSGTSYSKANITKEGVRIIRGGNLVNMKLVSFDNDVHLPKSFYDKNKVVKKGDIVVVASTGSITGIGRPAFADNTPENEMQIGAFLRIIRLFDTDLFRYCKYIFMSGYYRSHISNSVAGIGIRNLKEEHITKMLIPLPPLEEQQRIVDKLDQLLPLCEQLEKMAA